MKALLLVNVLAFCLSLSCLLVADEREQPGDAQQNEVLLTDELQPDYLIFVVAVVNGQERRLMLDTGTSCNIFNPRLEPQLGQQTGPIEGKVASGAAHAFTRFKPAEVKVGGLTLHGGRFCVTTALDHLERYAGEPIDGVLGVQSTRGLILALEFSKSRATVSDASQNRLFAKMDTLTLDKGPLGVLLFKSVRVDETELGAFEIDTGSLGYMSVNGDLFDQLVESGDIQNVWTDQAIDGKGKHTSQSGDLRAIEFGGHRLTQVPVRRSGRNAIGMRILSMFDIYLDVENALVALKPNDSFRNPIPYGRLGLGFEWENGKVVVGTVIAGGAAEQEKLVPGNRVIAIEGVDVGNLSQIQLRRLMRKMPGEILNLVIEENGRQVSKSIIATSRGTTVPSRTNNQLEPVN